MKMHGRHEFGSGSFKKSSRCVIESSTLHGAKLHQKLTYRFITHVWPEPGNEIKADSNQTVGNQVLSLTKARGFCIITMWGEMNVG